MTDKEILIEAFKRIGVDFELENDGEIKVKIIVGHVYFQFTEEDKFEEVI